MIINTWEEKGEYVPDWEKMHSSLRCYECKFADREMLGKGSCCQNINGPLPDKYGVCRRMRRR